MGGKRHRGHHPKKLQRKPSSHFQQCSSTLESFLFLELSLADGGKNPTGKIAELINRDFGSFKNFKEQFSATAVKLFGAGWAWLAQNQEGKLEILPMKDAFTPLTENKTPILTLDVWEHAYYIDYRNARPKFVEGFWELVNWNFANQNLKYNE